MINPISEKIVDRTELVWPGKYSKDGNRTEPQPVSLPLQASEVFLPQKARQATFQFLQDGAPAEGWRNRLIWGDNLLVLGSLLEELAGKIDLVYIDPPFAAGGDHTVKSRIGEGDTKRKHVRRQPSLEELAYSDSWDQALGSYLEMLSARLSLLRPLLSPRGTIFVHIDRRVAHHVKFILDEIFGEDRFINEIVWCYTGPSSPGMKVFAHKHDIIFWYANGPKWTFNVDEVRLPYKESTKRNEGRRTGFTTGNPDLVVVLNPLGKYPEDWWTIPVEAPASHLRTGYPTQKPERLLKRIVAAASNEGDLVADFFSGSGTTLAVAEKLDRRWIGCDSSRFAIHTARKRLLETERRRPFEISSLGKEERRRWQGLTFGERLGSLPALQDGYVPFILELYGAEPTPGLGGLHGKKGKALVHVGAVGEELGAEEVQALVEECALHGEEHLHLLGWEFSADLIGKARRQAAKKGIGLDLFRIPREAMDGQLVKKGGIRFFEVPLLRVEIKSARESAAGKSLRAEIAHLEFPCGDWIPDSVRSKITKWSDYIDSWAVDWEYGGGAFAPGFIAFRKRQDRRLPLSSAPHSYEHGPASRRLAVKVTDIFGSDAIHALEVDA